MGIFAKELCDLVFVALLDGIDEVEFDQIRLDVAQEVNMLLVQVKEKTFIQKIPKD
jgi:predicted NACHT family NTPase